MKEYIGKIHLRNPRLKVSDYPNSPHVRANILRGQIAECYISTDRITDNPTDVTCIACLILGMLYAVRPTTRRLPHE